MAQKLATVLESLDKDDLEFECDSVIVIAVRTTHDGMWQPNVVSHSTKHEPKDLAKMCLFAAEDIIEKSGCCPGHTRGDLNPDRMRLLSNKPKEH